MRFTNSRLWYKTKPSGGYDINWDHSLAKGLIGCYLFNEGSGFIVNEVAKGNRATGSSAFAWTQTDTGSGGSFNGTSVFVQSPYKAYHDLTNMSIVSRLKCTSSASAQIVANRNYNGTNVPFVLCLGGQPAYNGFAFYNGSWNASGITTDIRNDGKYHTVAGTFFKSDGVNNNLKYYIDGRLDNSIFSSASAMPSSTKEFDIGRYLNDSLYFSGKIDFVYVWNRTLVAREISEINQQPYIFINNQNNFFMGDSTIVVSSQASTRMMMGMGV